MFSHAVSLSITLHSLAVMSRRLTVYARGRCDANYEYADVRYESLGLGHLEVLSFVANMSSYQCFEPIDF